MIVACSKEDPVFKEEDFELCDLPLPDGYPNSWTHAGIEYVMDGYGGFHYFLTCSPYPNYNDDYENPMLFYAEARAGNIPPTSFTPYPHNPLQSDPGDGYNADPDILYADSSLHIINRPYLRPDSIWVNIQHSVIINEKLCFTKPTILYSNHQEPYNFGQDSLSKTTLISPSLVKYNGKYRCYHLVTNSYNDNSDCKGIVIMEGDSISTNDPFKMIKIGQINACPAKPWHMDVFQYSGKLYAIVCAYVPKENHFQNIPIVGRFLVKERHCYQYLAVSDDGINFKVYPKPLTTINSYRSSAFVREDGMFILYISTIDYKPRCSISQDGRNIMLAFKPFKEVINECKY